MVSLQDIGSEEMALNRLGCPLLPKDVSLEL